MQSKKFLFNWNVVKNNIKQYWPVWILLSIIMIIMIPVTLLFDTNEMSFMYNLQNYKEVGLAVKNVIYEDAISVTIFFAPIIALLSAVCVFSYLEKPSHCNFMHSLPLTRTQLYFTSYISGLIIMTIPNIIVCICSIFTSSYRGYYGVGEMLLWLFIMSVQELFYFSLAVIVMIISGSIVMSGIIYFVLLGFYQVFAGMIFEIITYTLFGCSSGFTLYGLVDDGSVLQIIDPLEFFYNIDACNIYNVDTGEIINISIENLGLTMSVGFIAAAVLTACGILLYRKRHSECSGDVIAIRPFRNIFRWVFAICLGLLVTFFSVNTFFIYYDYGSLIVKLVSFFFCVGFSVIGYILAEMLIRKSFRVFSKLKLRFLVFTAFAILFAGFICFDLTGREGYIPDTEDIVSVGINCQNYNGHANSKEAIEAVRAFHKTIIDNKETLISESNEYFYYQNGNYTGSVSLFIDYTMPDETYVTRHYWINLNSEFYDRMVEIFNDNCTEFVFDGLKAEDFNLCSISPSLYYINNLAEVDAEFLNKLYNAIQMDVLEGRLDYSFAKGNVYHYGNETNAHDETYCIEMAHGEYHKDISDYDIDNIITVYFNEDCTSIINLLSNEMPSTLEGRYSIDFNN